MTDQLPGELIYEYTAVVAEAVTARFQLAWKTWSLTRMPRRR
jgi:hypothetical protein